MADTPVVAVSYYPARRPSLRLPISYSQLIRKSFAVYDGSGIVGSTPVTAWNDKLGRAAKHLNVKSGAQPNNMVVGTINGRVAIRSLGSVSLKTPAPIDTPAASPVLVFTLAQFEEATPTANMHLFSSHTASSKEMLIATNFSSINRWKINQGSNLTVTGSTYTTASPRLFEGKFNFDTATRLRATRASGLVTSAVGNAGTEIWEFGTVFSNYSGGGSAKAKMTDLLVFVASQYYPTGPETTVIRQFLSRFL